MVDDRVQKAYNYAYAGLRMACRILPLAVSGRNAPANRRPIGLDEDRTIDRMRDYLAACAEQFYRLYRLEGGKSLQLASDLMKAGNEDLKSMKGLPEASQEFMDAARRALEKFNAAKSELDQNCQIRYRLWILNPWRYFPKKLD